ncbi:MAG: cupin domain-containing protein [Dehalococcoidia bacterium]
MAMREAVKTQDGLEVFNLKTPYVSAGQITTLLAETEGLWISIKVYADGGENALHAHAVEDHAFVVLEGEATFYGKSGEPTVLTQYEGMMLAKGTLYRFHNSGEGNLVMLRAGGGKKIGHSRMGPDGKELPGNSVENKTGGMQGVPIPGMFFGV